MRRAFLAAALGLAACASPPPPLPEAIAPQAACPVPWPERLPPLDLTLVLDTSRSTRLPAGYDVDGDGEVGVVYNAKSSDPGDTLLAAQVAAARKLLRVVRVTGGEHTRVALVSFAGSTDFPGEDSTGQIVDRRDALIQVGLTSDIAAVESALDAVLARGGRGATSFAPAMKLALRTQEPDDEERPVPRRMILFLSDSPTPVRPAPGLRIERVDDRMLLEARRAIKAGLAFETFGIGHAAASEPPHMLSSIAAATGGSYHAVGDAAGLHCQLLHAIREGPRIQPIEPPSDFASRESGR